ncbi:hypothetical protein L479_03246 [Exiguobacterium sp. S17]|nr:hypothetical protein L479_03246 [Exiguobacterium sp. S17]
MMQSHFSISDAKDYADAIDRTLHGFYIKGDKSHLILNVNQTDDIPLLDLMDALNTPLMAVDLINEISGDEAHYNKEDLDAKIRVQSKGIIELVASGEAMGLVIALGFVMVSLVGGKLTLSRKGSGGSDSDAGIESEGLIEKVLKWREQSHRQKLENKALHGDDKTFERYMQLQEKMASAKENLQLDLPEELKNVIDETAGETAVASDAEQQNQTLE